MGNVPVPLCGENEIGWWCRRSERLMTAVLVRGAERLPRAGRQRNECGPEPAMQKLGSRTF